MVTFIVQFIFHIVLFLHFLSFLHEQPFVSICCSYPGSFFHNLFLLPAYLSLFYSPAHPIFIADPSYPFHSSVEKEDYRDDSVALH